MHLLSYVQQLWKALQLFIPLPWGYHKSFGEGVILHTAAV